MKNCKIKDCNNKYYAKGYCRKHYVRFYNYPKNRKYRREYQKQYRQKHWGIGLKIHKCKIRECNKKIYSVSKYCGKHKYRIDHNLPTDLAFDCRPLHFKGKNNPNWRGGIAEYPNHHLMKKNRLIILMQNPKCEICGKFATQIHHRDFGKTNHKLSNLMAVCQKCNSKLRNPNKPQNSKYRRLYGMSLSELSKKYNCSIQKVKFMITSRVTKGRQ